VYESPFYASSAEESAVLGFLNGIGFRGMTRRGLSGPSPRGIYPEIPTDTPENPEFRWKN
jgi:hypothetical protein